MRFAAIAAFSLLAAGQVRSATFTVNSTTDAVDASPAMVFAKARRGTEFARCEPLFRKPALPRGRTL